MEFLQYLIAFQNSRENYGIQTILTVHIKKNVDTFLLCLKGVFSGNWESWNFLDTFNHSKNIFKRKNIFLTVRTFF